MGISDHGNNCSYLKHNIFSQFLFSGLKNLKASKNTEPFVVWISSKAPHLLDGKEGAKTVHRDLKKVCMNAVFKLLTIYEGSDIVFNVMSGAAGHLRSNCKTGSDNITRVCP